MRFAIFLPNWIGDVVMATPAIAALQKRYPDVPMVAVGRPYVQDVVAGSPWFTDYLSLKRDTGSAWQVTKQLRSFRANAAILFPNSFRVALIAAMGGCSRRVGYARYGRSSLLTDKFLATLDGQGNYQPTPILRDYNRLVERLGAKPFDRMELFTTTENERDADAVFTKIGIRPGEDVIGLNPGAAFGASKLWPSESFAELANRFAKSRNVKVVVLCGPSEREFARRIVQQSGNNNVHSIADFPLSLGLTKALVKRFSLLVTTDSGPRHFAAAFDRPVVTLFGPTHIEWTETFFDKAVNLQKKVPCGPCQLRVCPLDHRCMKELSVAEVFGTSLSLLRRSPAEGLRHAG